MLDSGAVSAPHERMASSILDLLRELIAVPSRADVDDPAPAFACVEAWLQKRKIVCHRILAEDGRTIGLTAHAGSAGAAAYLINATMDTAGYGDPAAWTRPPDRPTIDGTRLFGRGAGDSKAGVAIFCHLFAALHDKISPEGPGLVLLLDAEEHSGRFSGALRFLEQCDYPVIGAMIGYPGFDRIVTGARGLWRATLLLHGISAHSGSAGNKGVNAIAKSARVIELLADRAAALVSEAPPSGFPLPPKLTVTRIRGDGEFSLVPDSCALDLDFRLTPTFDAARARAMIEAALRECDAQFPAPRASEIQVVVSYPPYLLRAHAPLVTELVKAAEEVLGKSVVTGPCGPSNIGNLLALHGIDAVCGFGVAASGLHAANEWIDTTTILPVFEIYRRALTTLLNASGGERRWATNLAGKSFA